MDVRGVVFVTFIQHCIQRNVTHVEGVKSSSIYITRTVMLCVSKVSKEAQNGLTHLC